MAGGLIYINQMVSIIRMSELLLVFELIKIEFLCGE